MKRTLIVSTTAALLAVPAVAQADPPYVSRADAMLQTTEVDEYVPPAWMLNPAPAGRPYGAADVILGVTFVVGMVVLW